MSLFIVFILSLMFISDGSTTPEKFKKSKRKGKNRSLYSEPIDSVSNRGTKVYSDGRESSKIYEEPHDKNSTKKRSRSSFFDTSEPEVLLKPRAQSEGDILAPKENTPTLSLIRKMSHDDVIVGIDSVEGIYNEVDEELDSCTSDDDDEEEEIINKKQFILPGPRIGDLYACDQIKNLLGSSFDATVDLNNISAKYKLQVDEKEEFVAATLLKLFLERNK